MDFSTIGVLERVSCESHKLRDILPRFNTTLDYGQWGSCIGRVEMHRKWAQSEHSIDSVGVEGFKREVSQLNWVELAKTVCNPIPTRN